ncbi:YcnI family copper-binding membrane protein [Kocuria nitroreducens]|uniref:YcnI family copper-binding membrane protein n=1 Tax=Kocuria nitroreducens TaxID=3058914 RepID=UPI0036D7C20E
MTHPTSRVAAAGSALLLATGLTVIGLSPAAAHVSASSTTTAAEGYARITFTVPNESDTASTDRLEVRLPTDTPLGSVRVQPVEGWTAELTEEELPEPVPVGEGAVTEAVTTITWTADEEHAIAPDQFQTFTVSAGPLPAEGTTLVMPATQSYTDGRTVAWDQTAAEGEEEPQHPAPSLTTTAAETEGHAHGASAEHSAEATAADASPTGQSSTDNALTWVAVVAGVLGLVAGIAALLRTRRRG